MTVADRYCSPLGEILLAADEVGLTGLWFVGQARFGQGLRSPAAGCAPVIEQAKDWLDRYFSREKPDFIPPLHLVGTEFQLRVWARLSEIPYGQTTTYGALAQAMDRGQSCVSARAVGGAVARNPVSLIVPCHRVVGATGRLTGYAGGLERKRELLKLESGIS